MRCLLHLAIRRILFFFFATCLFLAMDAAAQGQNYEETASVATRDELPDKPTPVVSSTPPQNEIGANAVVTPTDAYERLTFDDRVVLYWKSIDNAGYLLIEPIGAALDQWQNSPSQWGQGWGAYGKRVGDEYGEGLAYRTIRFSVAATDGEDPRAFYTDDPRFWIKVRHGIKTTFISERNGGGGELPAFSRVAAIYGAALLADTWKPGPRATTGEALCHASISLLETMGYHVGGELWHSYKERLKLPAFIRNRY